MPLLRLLVAFALGLAPVLAFAEDPPLPSESETPATSLPATAPQQPALLATPLPQNSPALQSPMPNIPALSDLDQTFKQTPLGKETEEYRLHVEWRKLQDRVVNDPALIAMLSAAEAAPTDLEKRDRLRAYNNAYYAQMRALAGTPELQAYLEQKRAERVWRLAQPRVRPEGSGAPTLAPQKVKRKHAQHAH